MAKLQKGILTSLKWLFGFIFVFLLYVGLSLAYGTVYDFKPKQEIKLDLAQEAKLSIVEDSVLSFTLWNLGYGGLGAESDFFYESGSLTSGGHYVTSPKEYVEKNIKGSSDFVTSVKSDFFLFQEVDFQSKRSHFINQFDAVRKEIPDFAAVFAPNFKVDRIPIPVLEPWNVIGAVHSGLGTFLKYQPYESARYQLPGDYDWPTRIFQLDRCASVHRVKTAWNKDLVVINVHNSAYDKGGVLKKQQMDWLKAFFVKEYEVGNYVVIGGDWNQCPPNYPFDSFMPGKGGDYSQINIEDDFLPSDWTWGYDPRVPTNRKVAEPYVKDETFVTLIDFFLISPNVKVRKVKGLNQDFNFSDHQPVWMEVELVK